MKNIGFYSEDELMDLLQEGAIDLVDFLIYSPQWHDFYSDYCYERGICQDYNSATQFMRYMELEEIASYDYACSEEDYFEEELDLSYAINDLDFMN